MPDPILIGLILTAFFVGLATLKLVAALRARRGLYVLRPALFTRAERSFLGVLERVLPPEIRVFGKVRLGDIVAVGRGLGRGDRQGAHNRIDRKHVDFLLVRGGDLAPVAAIELDDRSHEAASRRARDAFVDEIFAGVGLPLLHLPVQASYDPAALQTQVTELLRDANARR